jgi:hypothetical protein
VQGGTSSKNEGFSLTSGDFPTLGSEKENSGKNTESQGILLLPCPLILLNHNKNLCSFYDWFIAFRPAVLLTVPGKLPVIVLVF